MSAVWPLLVPADYHEVRLFKENRKPNPVTAYGKSKLLAEQYLSDSVLPLAILRPTAVYGPGEKDLYIVFKMLQDGLDMYIGKNPQRFSFVYVAGSGECDYAFVAC